MSNKRKVTLEDLAHMVKGGFDEMGERMDKLDGRVDKLDGRVDKLEQRLDFLTQEFVQMKKDIAAIRFTITELAYKDEVRQLETRLTRIEKHLGLTPLKK